jgi:uracil-DNA glycosylase family 4
MPLNTKVSFHPSHDCQLCPRMVEYRAENRSKSPMSWNAPVSAWGSMDAELLIVGLAPEVDGANRTGRPFTGDYAGKLLYETLIETGFASGIYEASSSDSLQLHNCRVMHAVHCAPVGDLPLPDEVTTCNTFLKSELQTMPRLKTVLALGVLAHNAILSACGIPLSRIHFRHGHSTELPDGLILTDSYHLSRQNINSGILTKKMFHNIIHSIDHQKPEIEINIFS